jgi:hypothetical protein
MNWVPWLLFLHVLGAIVAFGPTFAFPIIGSMGGQEPQHANFATRVSSRIGNRLVEPLAIFQGITGVALIMATGRDLTNRANWWLDIAIILYLIALAFAIGIQNRNVARIIAMTSAPPPPGASGPPPGLPPLVRRVQLGGIFSTVLLVSIVALMVLKPQF